MLLAEGVKLAVIKEVFGYTSIAIAAGVYARVVDTLEANAAARLDTVRRRAEVQVRMHGIADVVGEAVKRVIGHRWALQEREPERAGVRSHANLRP